MLYEDATLLTSAPPPVLPLSLGTRRALRTRLRLGPDLSAIQRPVTHVRHLERGALDAQGAAEGLCGVSRVTMTSVMSALAT